MLGYFFRRKKKVLAIWHTSITHLFEEQKDVHLPFLFCLTQSFKNYWQKTGIRSSKACASHLLTKGGARHAPPIPFHPYPIRVFYSEDESLSNMASDNHSLIRVIEGCTSPIPFSTVFNCE